MNKVDRRRKPDLPYVASPKTAIGRDQRAFKSKRTEANRIGWEVRRQNHGPTGRRPGGEGGNET